MYNVIEHIPCCHCEQEVPVEKQYVAIEKVGEEFKYHVGHKYCVAAFMWKKKEEEQKVKKLLVLPSALDKNHPLHIGYVGKDK